MTKAALYSALSRAIAKAGGPLKLSVTLGESEQTIVNWRARGVPAKKARAFSAATGISVVKLRPNDWHLYWPDAAKRSTRPARIAA